MNKTIFKYRLLPVLLIFTLILFSCGSPEPSGSESTLVTAPRDASKTPASPETEPPDEALLLAPQLCSELTLEEKIGQLMLVRAGGDLETALADIEKYHVGGYVLFAADFSGRTPETAKEVTGAFQAKSKIPMFVAVDEEGGTVVRVSKYKQYRAEPFKSPRDLLALGGLALVRTDTIEKCKLLASLGVNLNLAPDADVSDDSRDFIYYRSAGNADTAVKYVNAFVESCQGTGVGSVLKHFPGYGGNVDTHTGIAVDKRGYSVFENSDFLPFKAGIDAGAEAVMVSHNIVSCMDETNPASLSPEVHRILREELGFGGVIITDDLQMDAISESFGNGESAVLAFEAGNDIICSSDLAEKYEALLEAAKSGRITPSRIDESVIRILACKIRLGIITP